MSDIVLETPEVVSETSDASASAFASASSATSNTEPPEVVPEMPEAPPETPDASASAASEISNTETADASASAEEPPEPIRDFLCPPEWPVSIIYTLFRCFARRILIDTIFGRSHFDILFGYIFTIDGRACAGIYHEDDPEMGIFDEYEYNNDTDHPDIVYCRCLPDSILDRYRGE